MATVDPLRYRTSGDDPETDPSVLAQMQQVADTLDATGDTTRISRAPTNFDRIAQRQARNVARRYMHDRYLADEGDVLYAGIDPEFVRMLYQADPEITITRELKNSYDRPDEINRDMYGGRQYYEYSTTFPKEVEGIGVPNPPLVRGLPRRTSQEVAAMSEEDMINEARRDVAGENVMAALLAIELSKQEAREPTRVTEMGEVRDLMQRSDRLPAHLSAQTDSILDEIARGEGRVRRTPDIEALLELVARKKRELFGGIAGLRQR